MNAAEVDPHVAQRYLLKRRLGKGAYGVVWKAVDRRTGEVVAIKKILDAFRDKTDAQRTFREIVLLQEFGDHPNIVRLLDVVRAENDKDIYLVFESMDTDLNAVICKGGLLQDIHRRYIFHQLLRATKFIHSGGVVHRDQKPSNVLLNANCLVKLCDFGLARSLSGLPEGPEGQALTEYVATRWYRAPEVLLSSSWYTPGVDMWSLGCILGEMLRGRPLFPGRSTLHQLELILQTIPSPSKEDLLALGSDHSASILHLVGARPQQELEALLPADTPPEALDLLGRLLVFAPDKRLTATQALQHPYVRRFHCPAQEWSLEAHVQLPVPEGAQLTAAEYRSHLYQTVLERRGYSRIPTEEGLERVPQEAGPSAPLPQACTLRPAAGPQVASSGPTQDLGQGAQHSVGPSPAPDDPCRAENVPRQRSDPLSQSSPPGGPGRGAKPPGATMESPSAPRWVKPRVQGAAPSLTSQANAQVAIQALIRSDPDRGRGPKLAGLRQVSLPPPGEVRLEPRPGRRMFRASALQGVQGAARAALGGYSQAYGTVCHSALGRLPLPPGPHA
ncbi:mitogen-activated protein kinase 15 isoform X2 [Sturnira hondurensis]|uniref:mitogen-activated protein kinase 15 isoform X2 n=1 Tax=Sturnira hondurensis TaxID=192404 RepID=UPI001879D843|nr:mitogen-activated protein kinase 15 isoform X2 [Sturnira hondurensis]